MTDLEKLYFIVDSSGNYYRINKNDQLIVTTDREDAGVFSFMDANRRIGGGKKAHFYSVIPVEESDEESKITVDRTEDETMAGNIKVETMTGSAKEEMTVSSERIHVQMEYNYDLSQINWLEFLNYFCYVTSSLKNYQDDLNGKLSEVDMKICDVMHYVELNELTDAESMQAVQILKEFREERRQIKDEMFCAEHIRKGIGTSANIAKAKESAKQIEKLTVRNYTPRKLKDLFAEHKAEMKKRTQDLQENNGQQFKKQESDGGETLTVECGIKKMTGILQEERREMNGERQDIGYEEKREADYERQDTGYEEKREADYERQDTIYDGKKNDWRTFAVTQLDFFENVEWHMDNLENDLDVIEDEIEETLRMIENANYNVAQGYKVFKKLKDLRNERREKIEELDCLDALTERFDCGAMAEVYRESLQNIDEVLEENIEDEAVEMAG